MHSTLRLTLKKKKKKWPHVCLCIFYYYFVGRAKKAFVAVFTHIRGQVHYYILMGFVSGTRFTYWSALPFTLGQNFIL